MSVEPDQSNGQERLPVSLEMEILFPGEVLSSPVLGLSRCTKKASLLPGPEELGGRAQLRSQAQLLAGNLEKELG